MYASMPDTVTFMRPAQRDVSETEAVHIPRKISVIPLQVSPTPEASPF